MAEEKKGEMDPKAQAKYLRAAYKEEHKKNVKLQQEIAEITTKLNQAEDELKERVTPYC